jgi:hypothetical protein
LVISGEENGVSPILDPHDISRAIHFFRLGREASNPQRDDPGAAGREANLELGKALADLGGRIICIGNPSDTTDPGD